MKKTLPIGISTLSEIVGHNRVYVDKTHFVEKLAVGKYYFLSRPRRFGKSLFLDTLKQAFLGNKALFNGLYLEHHWDWDVRHPVIHFSFGGSSAIHSAETLDGMINAHLQRYAKEFDITLPDLPYGMQFDFLIKEAAKKYAPYQVVILVDEYDKPILDVIDDPEQALANRETLKTLYSVIKDNDASLRFVFLTGVTKFSKVGLFSGLNNLDEITLDSQYADICGYTQVELESAFQDYLLEGEVDKTMLKLWYNGYNFSGAEAQKVYNPFDILLFCKNFEYKNYWFETGSPSFLIKLIQQNKYYVPSVESIMLMDSSFSSFDINNIEITSLLFQTGYLTIKKNIMLGAMRGYELGYPNLEVKASLNNKLLTIGASDFTRNSTVVKLLTCINSADLSALGDIFQSHFASIPHDWYRNNDIQHYEGFYASIVYSYFCALGYHVIAEDSTNMGQMALTVILPDKILILEFKLVKNGDAASALTQIKAKKYPEKYQSERKPVYLVGISFDPESRNVRDSAIEILQLN